MAARQFVCLALWLLRLQIACQSGNHIKPFKVNDLQMFDDGFQPTRMAVVSKVTQYWAAGLQRDPLSSASTVSSAGSMLVASTWVRSS